MNPYAQELLSHYRERQYFGTPLTDKEREELKRLEEQDHKDYLSETFERNEDYSDY